MNISRLEVLHSYRLTQQSKCKLISSFKPQDPSLNIPIALQVVHSDIRYMHTTILHVHQQGHAGIHHYRTQSKSHFLMYMYM